MKRKHWFLALGLCIPVAVIFLVITYLGWNGKPFRIQHLMLLAILGSVFTAILKWKPQDAFSRWVWFILFTGVVMRVGYALYTPTMVRAHDIGVVELGSSGHAGYVLQLFINGALPATNDVQFTQPPLYYLISAGWMSLYRLLTGITNDVELFEAVRLTSVIASCFTLLICYEIGNELKLSGIPLLCYLAICTFLPNHYLLAGRANPDALSVFFIYAIVLYALRWYRSQSTWDVFLLALCFGLGMMTKLTVAVLAVPIGALMAYMLWKKCCQEKSCRLVRQLAMFLIISVPLGLWYPIRNAILFGQPIGGIYEIYRGNIQYIGDVSLWKRFGLFSPKELFAPLYISSFETDNLWLYSTKTAVFGMFSYTLDALLPILLMLSNLSLTLISLASVAIGGLKAIRGKRILWVFLGFIYIAAIVAFVLFNIRYPFRCSMDFRYMVVTSLIGALAIGKASEYLSMGNGLHRLMCKGMLLIVAVFSACSIIMYTAI